MTNFNNCEIRGIDYEEIAVDIQNRILVCTSNHIVGTSTGRTVGFGSSRCGLRNWAYNFSYIFKCNLETSEIIVNLAYIFTVISIWEASHGALKMNSYAHKSCIKLRIAVIIRRHLEYRAIGIYLQWLNHQRFAFDLRRRGGPWLRELSGL